MLKTNTKQVKEAIKNYIIDSASDYLIDCEYIQDGATYDEIKKAIASAFINEKLTNYASAKTPEAILKVYYNYNLFEAFKDWAQGLSCGGLFDYYLNSAVQLVGDWLQETPEERAKYDEIEAEERATQLIFRELQSAILERIYNY